MMRHMKVTFSGPCLLACLIALSATAYAQGASCRTTEFTAALNGDEAFSKSIGASLRLRLIPLKRAWGWVVSASPMSDDRLDVPDASLAALLSAYQLLLFAETRGENLLL
jgi:hypothetical protein